MKLPWHVVSQEMRQKTAREDNLALKKNSYFAWEGEAGGGEETLIGM